MRIKKVFSPLLISMALILLCFFYFIVSDYDDSNKTLPDEIYKQVKISNKGAEGNDINKKMLNSAKNVILLIGDGMGYNQVKSGSYYIYGTERSQVYQRFPVRYGMSTYMAVDGYDPSAAWAAFDAVKAGATDSAAAATAMASGQKTYRYGVGVDCRRNPLDNIVEKAEELGKSTGIVTSVQFSHATPAAFVAHNVTRKNYEEIAREMIQKSSVDLIMGCGHPRHDHDGNFLEEPQNFQFVGGEKLWQELQLGVAGNDADSDGKNEVWTLIESRPAFQNLMQGTTPERVLGVARVAETLQQKRTQQGVECAGAGNAAGRPYTTPLTATVPSLAEMTGGALNVLDNNPKGFFIMIEGGAIDWASHDNQADRVIEEQVDFDTAVSTVIEWVEKNSSWEKTLVIVTSDHETGYLTGPGSEPGWEPIINNGKNRLPGMEWHSEEHTNELVPFFARGPNSWKFAELVAGQDPERGAFIDNTALYRVILEVLQD